MGYVTNPFKKNVSYTEDTGNANPTVFSDNFDAPLDPNRWVSVIPGNANIEAVGGLARFTMRTDGTAGYNNLTSQMSYDMTAGGSSKTISLDIITHLAGYAVESYLLLKDASGGYAYIYEENGNSLCRIFTPSGSQAVGQFYGAVDNTAWRYRYEPTEGDGGTLYLELLQGGVWTSKISATGAVCGWDFTGVDIILQAGRYYGGGAADLWEVDNFVVSPDIAPPPAETFPLNTYTKNAGGDGYNSGLFGKEYILARKPDQSVSFEVVGAGFRRSGWATFNQLAFDQALMFEFALLADNTLWIYENNNLTQYNTNLTWQVGNQLRIQIVREGSVTKVKYWKREKRKKPEKLIYTSTQTSDFIDAQFPLAPKSLFYAEGSQVRNMLLEYSPDATDVMLASGNQAILYNKTISEKPLQKTAYKSVGGATIGGEPESMQFIYKGTNIAQATAGLAYFRASGKPIKELRIWSNLPNTFGNTVYNVYKNGVALFAGGNRPIILQGQNYAEKLALSIATSPGDVITLGLEEMPPNGVIATPITFEAKY